MIITFEKDIKNLLIDKEKPVNEKLTGYFLKRKKVRQIFPEILSEISKILYKASLTYTQWEKHYSIDEQESQFTFFPGYIMNQKNGDPRIFFKRYIKTFNNPNENCDLELFEPKLIANETEIQHYIDKAPLGFESLDIDFYHSHSCNWGKSKKISLLSLAYHFLFDKKNPETSEDDESSFDHVVGGTHQWVSEIADEIALNDSLDPLELLAFYGNKKDARENQVKYRTWINIPFNFTDTSKNKIGIENEIFLWCKSVVEKLDYPSNLKYKVDVSVKWPYNPQCPIDNSDYPNKTFKSHILIFRAYIVAFWLECVFNPEDFFDIDASSFDNQDDINKQRKSQQINIPKLLTTPKGNNDTNALEAWVDFPFFFLLLIIKDQILKFNKDSLLKDIYKNISDINYCKTLLKDCSQYLNEESIQYFINTWLAKSEINKELFKKEAINDIKQKANNDNDFFNEFSNCILDEKSITFLKTFWFSKIIQQNEKKIKSEQTKAITFDFKKLLTDFILDVGKRYSAQHISKTDPIKSNTEQLYIRMILDNIDHTANDIEEYFNYLRFRIIQINILKSIFENKNNHEKLFCPKYSYWYTIPFKHRINFSTQSDQSLTNRHSTGSAMILSNENLDKEYFRFVIPWIERMYDALREYDTALQATKQFSDEIEKKTEDCILKLISDATFLPSNQKDQLLLFINDRLHPESQILEGAKNPESDNL